MINEGCFCFGLYGTWLFGDEAREVFGVEVKFDWMRGGSVLGGRLTFLVLCR